jgi:hypothetical protein
VSISRFPSHRGWRDIKVKDGAGCLLNNNECSDRKQIFANWQMFDFMSDMLVQNT